MLNTQNKQLPNNMEVVETCSHSISYNQAKTDVNNDYLTLLNSTFSTDLNSLTINDIGKLYKLKQVDGDTNVFSITQKTIPNISTAKRRKKKSIAPINVLSKIKTKSKRPKKNNTITKKEKTNRSKSTKPIKINGKFAIEAPKKSTKGIYNLKKFMKDRIPTNLEFQ